jgi:hypothetical protein
MARQPIRSGYLPRQIVDQVHTRLAKMIGAQRQGRAGLGMPAAAAAPADVPAVGQNKLPRVLAFAIIFALVSLTLLDRFGVRISAAYSINPSMFAFYGILMAMLFGGVAQLNGITSSLYVCMMSVAALSFLLNATFDVRQLTSTSSLLLLTVLYIPFMFVLPSRMATYGNWLWMLRKFILFAMVCAVFGIAQYFLQIVFRPTWLFDFTPLIPAPIRGSGLYNTTNPVGSLIKSNGFFLREASGFSFFMGFALICEWVSFKRKWIMLTLALGVVVSYSGSGPVVLLTALLFPLGVKTIARVIACGVIAAVVVLLFGDALNLSYTLGRVGEFESNTSSAYCRFIAPGKLVVDQIDSDAWSALLGHGPGTTQKLSTVCETTYGKLLFEYGLIGALVFSTMILVLINKSWIPVRIRAALVVQWYLLGGNLLAPEALLLIFFVCGMWPRSLTQASAATESTTALGADDQPAAAPYHHPRPVRV